MASFLRHGVTYNLYVYEEPEKLPGGVVLKDAAAILPRAKVFHYSAGEFNVGSIAGFANLFRYTLLQQAGGWWVDTDVCCLKPFDLPGNEVYFEESSQTEPFYVGTSCFKAPAGSSVMRECLSEFVAKDVTRIVHGETGPRLMTNSILRLGNRGLVLTGGQVAPVPWWDWRRLLWDETLSLDGCYAVHFWNAMLTAAQVDKSARFPSNAPFERLKRAYLG